MANQMGNERRKLPRKERRLECLRLRREGKSHAQIAEVMGFSKGRAGQIIREELQSIAEETAKDAAVLLEMELYRLDALTEKLWSKLSGDDAIPASNAILRCMERRSKLLGLDAPESHVWDNAAAASPNVLQVTIGGERVDRLVGLEDENPAEFRGQAPHVTPRSGSDFVTNGNGNGSGKPHTNGNGNGRPS